MFSGNTVQYLWAPSSLLSWSWLFEKPRWVNILSPLGQTPQRTAFLKPRRCCSASPSSQAGMLISFALAWLEMRTICCTLSLSLLYCSVSVDVVVVFVQSLLEKKKRKRRQNMLIPTTSCLWRQEEVTVAVLSIATDCGCPQVCTLLQTLVVAQICCHFIDTNDLTKIFSLLQFLGNVWNCGHTVIKDLTPWHFLPLCLRTFSVFVCTLTAVRAFI